MSIDIQSVLLPTMLFVYGLGYLLIGMFNIQNILITSWFKIPLFFALFDARIGQTLSGLFCMALSVWVYLLMG